MRSNVFRNTGSLRRFPASLPQHFRSDGLIRSPTIFRAWKQIRLGMHPAPVLAQGLQQFRTERHVAVTVSLAMPNVDQHAHTIDVSDLEMAEFRPAHASRIQRHQHGAME